MAGTAVTESVISGAAEAVAADAGIAAAEVVTAEITNAHVAEVRLTSSYPVQIRRCQHIKTSGAQCGSPALKEKDFCYYHDSNRTESAPIYLEGDRYHDHNLKIPPLEDAHAIQTMLRHILLLLMERRIDRKDASLILYGLQIASGNLKPMQAEKPRPTQVVRDLETVAETPMGMTPWAANEQGHEMEETGAQKDRELRELDAKWNALCEDNRKQTRAWSEEIGTFLNQEKTKNPLETRYFLHDISDRMRATAEKMETALETGAG